MRGVPLGRLRNKFYRARARTSRKVADYRDAGSATTRTVRETVLRREVPPADSICASHRSDDVFSGASRIEGVRSIRLRARKVTQRRSAPILFSSVARIRLHLRAAALCCACSALSRHHDGAGDAGRCELWTTTPGGGGQPGRALRRRNPATRRRCKHAAACRQLKNTPLLAPCQRVRSGRRDTKSMPAPAHTIEDASSRSTVA